MMKHLGLIALTVSFLAACDPGDESLGDTGAEETGSSSSSSTGEAPPETASESGEETGEVPDSCPDGGPADRVTVSLDAESFPDGDYEVILQAASNESDVESCAFSLPGPGTGCVTESSDGTLAAQVWPDFVLESENRITVIYDGVVAYDELLTLDVEVIGDECWTSREAEVAIQVDAFVASCESLEEDFEAAFVEVRGCTEASECGTILEGASCGCTRRWIGRLDTDPAPLTEAMQAGQAAECDWAMFGGVCDCPEADGFACVDNICTWNYIDQ